MAGRNDSSTTTRTSTSSEELSIVEEDSDCDSSLSEQSIDERVFQPYMYEPELPGKSSTEGSRPDAEPEPEDTERQDRLGNNAW